MGPATMLIDSSIFLCWFLGISTTNLLASTNPPPDGKNPTTPNQCKIIQTALSTSLLAGLFITLVMSAKAVPLLKWISGAQNAALIPQALTYVRIRALSAPLAVVGMVCQAICLASVDVVTPAIGVVLSAIVNIVLDLGLCVYPFQYGIGGAAVATALANVASSVLLISAVYKKNFKGFLDEGIAKGSGLVQRLTRFKSILALPTNAELTNLIKFAGAIFGVIVGKLVCYSSLTLAATRFGVSSLAAHNVLLRIFFFFSTFGDSLSQSVQNFLPAVFTMNKNPTSKAYKRFEGFHIACAGVVGLLFSVVSSVFTRSKAGASVFTTSPPILKLIAECAPFLSLSLVVHPFVMIMEGAIIAKRDTNFLLFTYGVTFTALLTSMKTASSLKGVWTGFLGFQLLRCVQFGIRVLMRRNKEVVYVRVK